MVQTAPVMGHIEPEKKLFTNPFHGFIINRSPRHLMAVVSQLTKLDDDCVRMVQSTQAKNSEAKIKKVAQCAPVSPTVTAASV